MNSLGNSSKWACYDSPPSASSFLLSESDQTEDEADVFSEAEGYSGRAKSLSANEGITVSANYLGFAGQPEPHSKSKYDKYKHCHNETEHPNSASSPGAATLGSSCATPGDLAFAQKVTMIKLIPRFLLQYYTVSCSSKPCLSLYFFSVQICTGLFVLCLSFYMDLRQDDLTKVCVVEQ